MRRRDPAPGGGRAPGRRCCAGSWARSSRRRLRSVSWPRCGYSRDNRRTVRAAGAGSGSGSGLILRARQPGGVGTMNGRADMAVHKSVTTVIWAAALALGLAACGGGGGGSGESKPPVTDDGAMERAVALAEAVQAARNTGTDGSFDDTPYMVVPTVMATHDGTAVTIGVTESRHAVRRHRPCRRVRRAEGRPPPRSPAGPGRGSSAARRASIWSSMPTSARRRRCPSPRKT